jgi:hypothetical protein
MPPLPHVRARKYIRQMRGQTRAELVEADDGRQYVVKYQQNPLGVRVLINELICSYFMRAMGIRTPKTACVEIDDTFLHHRGRPGAVDGPKPVLPSVGIHFGSQYPLNATNGVVYDFLPDTLLPEVANRADFFGLLVFDQWVSHLDWRQAIFFRSSAPNPNGEGGWLAEAIDNEGAFQGCDWALRDSSIQGFYCRRDVYGSTPTFRDTKMWLERLSSIRHEVFAEVLGLIPESWLTKEEGNCSRLLQRLDARRERVPTLIREPIKWLRDQANTPRPSGRAKSIRLKISVR